MALRRFHAADIQLYIPAVEHEVGSQCMTELMGNHINIPAGTVVKIEAVQGVKLLVSPVAVQEAVR